MDDIIYCSALFDLMRSYNKYTGAEANITFTNFLGRPAIIKFRPIKQYRIKELDTYIRSSRTRNEAHILHEARMVGVRTPCVYDVDNKNCSITMELIPGKSIKDVLDSHPNTVYDLCSRIGKTIAKMHSARICHGDLTTSNMILSTENQICLIDFSMGCIKASTEEIGVDIRLLERSFTSAHTEFIDALEHMMCSYYSNVKDADDIKHKVNDIKSRCRYT